jgi:hypothetical protein
MEAQHELEGLLFWVGDPTVFVFESRFMAIRHTTLPSIFSIVKSDYVQTRLLPSAIFLICLV